MTNEHFQGLVQYWRKILRLQDWDLTARLARGYDLEDKEGRCSQWPKLKLIEIEVLDPIDFRPGTHHDVEETLVHELLHVHFCSLDQKWEGAEQVLYEQAIETMAWALVKLNRGAR
jgi:hypothetical protein